MNAALNAYVHFDDGRAREAMTFYQGIFGGDLDIRTFGDLQVPDAPADGVMHSALTVDGEPLLMGADNYQPGKEERAGFSLTLSGSDADELRDYFDKLSSGGAVTLPLSKQTWGDEFGMVTDRYGVDWMVNIAAPEA